ncbi:MAG: hypothetical protein C3F02_03190 [Parcubacteria group bacterium]|nr:MAG: hypothetical protein C3F02_03190 [Parcubacteria group bacterium]
MKKYSIFGVVILAITVLVGYFVLARAGSFHTPRQAKVLAQLADQQIVIAIQPDMTFSTVAEQAGLEKSLTQTLFEAAFDVYDLSKIRVGREMTFIFNPDGSELKRLIYPINTEEELYIDHDAQGVWKAHLEKIDYEVKIKTVAGQIDSSLYESAMAQGVDIRAIIALADVFAWSIDFGMGIRQGDTYKFIYEERYRDGAYVMPGKIIAARFVNDGKTVEGYYFEDGTDDQGALVEGYYDSDGASLQKIFLKNPVSYKYISSGFTTGRRYISAFNISTGHRAIDYAAQYGAPVRAVGDGQITHASWSSAGYGNLISIRHNETFSTNYGHLSKIYVRGGQKVKQGDIIGAIGSTGLSTGPHLHFEMVKNGTKINPLTIEIPSGKAVSDTNLDKFKAVVKDWQAKLN